MDLKGIYTYDIKRKNPHTGYTCTYAHTHTCVTHTRTHAKRIRRYHAMDRRIRPQEKMPENFWKRSSEMENVLHGSCEELLHYIPDNSVDIIITSPPYNLGNSHHTRNHRHNPYDDEIPEGEYQLKQAQILARLKNKLTETGSIFYNHKNRIKDGVMITPYQWILHSGLIIKQEIVWWNGSPNFDKCRFYPQTERIYWLSKTPVVLFKNEGNFTDVFTRSQWQPVGTKGEHTRAFPEQIVRDILSCFPTGLTVLDPYMGSGTVGVVCKQMGFKFIGIEIDTTYFAQAMKRIYETEESWITIQGDV